ncbi:MAG: lysylphosphatidylglycerol synthase transmembrane domain-containing protein, partial [Candidatus Portnoybacteria bacterium]|nr:lysylphosphatidylglycerol synthase transmembrane domain-containing protein [Candidatus Portnoybacteria bacterium]
MNSKKRFFLGLIFTPILVLIIFLKFDFEGLRNAFARTDPWLLIAAGFLLLPPFFLSAWRWKKNIEILGVKSRFRDVFLTFLANFPAAKISPGNSGDFIRSYLLKHKLPLGQSIGCVFAERIIDIYVLALISLIANVFIQNKMAIFLDLGLIAASVFFLLFSKKIKLRKKGTLGQNIDHFFNFFEILSKNPKTFLAITAYTTISWLFVFVSVKLTFMAV